MTLLKELVAAEDFTAAVRQLADPISRRLDLPGMYQLGLVVPDAVAAAQTLQRDMALHPAFILDTDIGQWTENGKTAHGGRIRYGFTSHRGYELELIEPRQGGDFYARDVHPGGELFLQHLGFRVRDVDVSIARLARLGVPLLARGRGGTGPMVSNFAYLDTRAQFGIITELICSRFLGIPIRMPSPALARYMGRRQVRGGKRVLSL